MYRTYARFTTTCIIVEYEEYNGYTFYNPETQKILYCLPTSNTNVCIY
jgi:hypothetical protein